MTTKTLPQTLADLRRLVFGAYTFMEQHFTTPSHDWPNLLAFVQSPNGVEVVDVEELTMQRGRPSALESEQGKDAVGEMLRIAIATYGAYRYAVVINGHGLVFSEEKEEAKRQLEQYKATGVRLEHLPGSFEQLTLALGDAETEEVWHSKIELDEGVRVAGKWERYAPDISYEGRFVGLNELLRQHRPTEGGNACG